MSAQARRQPYVLVVEDDGDTRQVIAAALHDSGIDAVALSDGAVALRACVERDPSVIVLDLALPGLSGTEFAEAYRRLPSSRAHLLVVSGTPHGAESAARINAETYLSKPFRIERLVDTVIALLTLPPR